MRTGWISVNSGTSAITSATSGEENTAATAASSRKIHSQMARVPGSSRIGKKAAHAEQTIFSPEVHHQRKMAVNIVLPIETILRAALIADVDNNLRILCIHNALLLKGFEIAALASARVERLIRSI